VTGWACDEPGDGDLRKAGCHQPQRSDRSGNRDRPARAVPRPTDERGPHGARPPKPLPDDATLPVPRAAPNHTPVARRAGSWRGSMRPSCSMRSRSPFRRLASRRRPLPTSGLEKYSITAAERSSRTIKRSVYGQAQWNRNLPAVSNQQQVSSQGQSGVGGQSQYFMWSPPFQDTGGSVARQLLAPPRAQRARGRDGGARPSRPRPPAGADQLARRGRRP
jgi:hypothetical protein